MPFQPWKSTSSINLIIQIEVFMLAALEQSNVIVQLSALLMVGPTISAAIRSILTLYLTASDTQFRIIVHYIYICF
jgi:hypothetical protein